MNDLTRPIIGIENRTAQEVFDIMCDRYRSLTAAGVKPRVKPLVWRDAPAGKYISKTIIADSLIGEFSVTVGTGAAYFDEELTGLDGKDSCQRVFNAAILSALTTEGE